VMRISIFLFRLFCSVYGGACVPVCAMEKAAADLRQLLYFFRRDNNIERNQAGRRVVDFVLPRGHSLVVPTSRNTNPPRAQRIRHGI